MKLISLANEWEDEISTLLGASQVDDSLCKPQRSFSYPAPPQFPAAVENRWQYLCDLLRGPRNCSIRFFNDLSEALEAFFHQQKSLPKRMALSFPVPAELQSLKEKYSLEWIEVPRDPADFDVDTIKNAEAFFISNPHRADGFYYLQDHLDQLHARIRSAHKELPIFVDESLGAFCFNELPPGNFKAFIEHDPHLYLASSIYPCLSPLGPELSWIFSKDALKPTKAVGLSPEEFERAGRSILAFETKGGKSMEEFQRRLLAVPLGLRQFTEGLSPLISSSLIKIPHWPLAGFYLMIDFRPLLIKSGLSLRELLIEIARETAILLLPGDLFNRPHSAQACFAASPRYLGEMSVKLSLSLKKYM